MHFKINKKLWFGRKFIGWGWDCPQRWEGWLLLISFILLVKLFYIIALPSGIFLLLIFLISIIFFIILYKTSGKPRWGSWWDKLKKRKLIK